MAALDDLKTELGPRGWVADAAEAQRYLVDIRGMYRGAAALVVKPSSTQQVADVVRACRRDRIPLVPQGGNTGLCGGAIPDASGASVVVSLERMRAIRDIDTENASMTVEAGVVLAAAQDAARERGLLLPLSLGAEGSCQIGGTIATNAGGHHVRKYGSMRNLVLGLEVVLPDGSILDTCRSLRKDNLGFDLKQLFVGSEGTLGVITAATLRLFPLPREKVTVLAAVGSLSDAITCFNRLQGSFAAEFAVCELMSRACVDLAVRNVPGVQPPFAAQHPWMLLLEWESDAPMDARIEESLGTLAEEGRIEDAIVAGSLADAQRLWHLREAIVEAERAEQGSVKHDIAISISAITRFVEDAQRVLPGMMEGLRLQVFGHLGDGNLHFNLVRPPAMSRDDFLAQAGPLTAYVHEQAIRVGGTVSAEHGVGQSKLDDLERYRSGPEKALMATLKHAVDPTGIMNPGKVVRSTWRA